MRVLFCALVIALMAVPGTLIAAQAPSNQELSRQVDALERRVARLERGEKKETRQEKRAAKKAEAKAKAKDK